MRKNNASIGKAQIKSSRQFTPLHSFSLCKNLKILEYYINNLAPLFL